MRSTTWMMLAPGWRCTLRMIAGVVFAQAPSLSFSGAADHVGHVGQPHRAAVAVGDHRVGVLGRALDLVVGVDGRGLRRPVEISLRRVDVEVADGGAHVVDVEAVGGERLRVELDAHRRPVAAADADQADAGELRDLLRQPRLAQILQLGQRHVFRGDRERQDRRVGRIDLGVDRRNGQIARAADCSAALIAACTSCSATSRLRSRVNCRVIIEAPAELAEVIWFRPGICPSCRSKRSGHRRRHHFRAGARIEGLHLDRRIVDLRQASRAAGTSRRRCRTA